MASRMTAKAFIGSEIRRAREARGISRAKLAKPLMVSESLIVAWESGRQGILPEHMKRLLGIEPGGTLGKPLLEFTPEFVIRMIEALVNGEAQPEWEGKWRAVEESTTGLYSFDTTFVNGLLQCPEYMQAMLDSDDAVKRRLERQQRFLSGDARPALVAVMDESVLRRNIGGPEVMRRQMDFLLECTEAENVIMQFVPMRSAVSAKYRTPFMIATMDDGREVAYAEGVISGEVIERPEDIATLRWCHDRYRAAALRPDESVVLTREMVEQWAM